MRIVVTLAFLLLCCTTISVSQNCINQDAKLNKEVQQQNVRPQFPGGNKALVDFLSKNIKYPESAKQNKVSGRVVVMFQVDVDGTISNVSIAQSLTPECDKEAKRVVSLMPKWTPAIQNGKPIRSFYQIPIVFKLN